MKLPALLLAAAVCAACALPGTAAAQATTEPAAPAELHRIEGFRSARFGMTADEVRAAIARDFQAPPDTITEVANPAENTRVLAVKLASLPPGPGPAVLTYILGATSQRLVQVNVTWRSGPQPSDEERNLFGAAGVRLRDYFVPLGWKAKGSVTNVSEGPNGVLLFAGVDPRDAGVELHLSGIYLTNASGVGPAPQGEVMLRISYVQNLQRRDVAKAKS